MITIYHKTAKETELSILNESKTDSWIRVQDPTDEDVEYLIKNFGLEDGLIRDALDPNEVPRLELDNGVVYIYTRVPYESENRIITLPVLISIGDNFVCTVSKMELPFLDKFVSGKIQFATTQKTKLILQIFSEINRAYDMFMNDINRRVRRYGVNLEQIKNKDILQFVKFEEILNDFLSALSSSNVVLNNLMTRKIIEFHEDDKDLIEDVSLSNGQLIESSKGNLKNIVNIREAYSAIMTHDLNRIIKVLTVLTILLNVPVLVSSLYGMNVSLPGSNSPYAFWWIVVITSLSSILLLIFFIKKKWF